MATDWEVNDESGKTAITTKALDPNARPGWWPSLSSDRNSWTSWATSLPTGPVSDFLLQERAVLVDELLELVSLCEQLVPLFLIQGDRKASEPVDRYRSLIGYLERQRPGRSLLGAEGFVLGSQAFELSLHVV